MNILSIEDNAQNMYLVRFLLEQRGHRVIEAGNGPEGFAAIAAAVPDLVLLDIQLPQMDGYTVARILRENPALDAMPIIAVTSYAMNSDRLKALAAGCDAYIEKPINPETFADDVEAVAAAGRRTQGGAS